MATAISRRSPVIDVPKVGTRSAGLVRRTKSEILTNGSLRPVFTDVEISDINNIPILFNDDEVVKKLQQRNPSLDLSQYLIKYKPQLDFSKHIIDIKFDDRRAVGEREVDYQEFDAVPIVSLKNVLSNGDSKEKKSRKIQRLRNSWKGLKKRVLRSLTIFTACVSGQTKQ